MTTLISNAFRFGSSPEVGFASTMVKWARRAKQRRELASLDHNMLKDIGISTAQRDREIQKSFWED